MSSNLERFIKRQPIWLMPIAVLGVLLILPALGAAKVFASGRRENIAKKVVDDYKYLIKGYCSELGFGRPDIIAMQICQESQGNPNAENPKDPGTSRGLMQITYATGLDLFKQLGWLGKITYPGEKNTKDKKLGGTGLYNALVGLKAGILHMRNLYNKYGTYEDALSAYNTGGSLKTHKTFGSIYIRDVISWKEEIYKFW